MNHDRLRPRHRRGHQHPRRDGVTLAAIQALNSEVSDQDLEVGRLKQENAELKAAIDASEARLDAGLANALPADGEFELMADLAQPFAVREKCVFLGWPERMEKALRDSGVPAKRAGRLARTVVAATEGAVALARASRTSGPLDEVVAELSELVESARAR